MPKLPSSLKPTNYLRGMIAEIYAMGYLMGKGYRIIAWRYKTRVGEVDIVAKRGAVLAFVEVKLRSSHDKGMEAISTHAQQRISRAAGYFLATNPRFSAVSPRFDAISVSGFRVRHLDNAWFSTT